MEVEPGRKTGLVLRIQFAASALSLSLGLLFSYSFFLSTPTFVRSSDYGGLAHNIGERERQSCESYIQHMPMPSRSLRIIYVCGTDRDLDARECFLCSPLICFDRSAALPGWKGLTGRGRGVAGTLYITQVWEKSFVFHAELRRDTYRYCEEKKRRERICENLVWMTDWQKHKGTRSSTMGVE